MYYRIRHVTRYFYSSPVSESLTELRMHPRTEAQQRCLDYNLQVTPRAQVFAYRDWLGNSVHHFATPAAHNELQIVAESLVEMKPWDALPHFLAPSAWDELQTLNAEQDFADWLLPSPFTPFTPQLEKLMVELRVERRDDPLSLALELTGRLYDCFEYVPHATRVDSPIDVALALRKGVCQDFTHIFLALLRSVGIPCRYVSGYLYHGKEDHDRSAEGATHAWAEVFLPSLGWIGLDPTNNQVARERHIRTAIGRDYSDVPPTRGVFKGDAKTSLGVAVAVSRSFDLPPELAQFALPAPQDAHEMEELVAEAGADAEFDDELAVQQQQQQQQQ